MRARGTIALSLGAVMLVTAAAIGVMSDRHSNVTTAQLDRELSTIAAEQVAALTEYFERSRGVLLTAVQDSIYSSFYLTPGTRVDEIRADDPLVVRINDNLAYLERLYPGAIGEACFIDGGGAEIARVVDHQAAAPDELSHDESRNPFFAPTFALPAGVVYQAKPYESPDTNEWVISNSTRLPSGANAIVHFEVTLESFRAALARSSGGFEAQVVDARTGAVVIDSRHPQRVGARLADGVTPVVGFAERAGLHTVDGRRVAYRHVDVGPGNANDWVIVVAADPSESSRPLAAGLAGPGGGIGLLLICHGMAAWRRSQQRLRRAAGTDPLTGLANRRAFTEHTTRALARANAAGRGVAMLLADLDRFKDVNDTLGHRVGDLLLADVARRLRETVRDPAVLARLGGDEFAVALPDIADEASAVAIATRVHEALSEPFVLDGMPIWVAASVGIAVSPTHGRDLGELMQRADVAMYEAKRTRNGHAVYTEANDPHSPDRLRLGGELREAIARGELTVHYQPQCRTATGQIVGVEALVRWTHPQRGLLSPMEFLPLAEELGLMPTITRFVLGEAIADARALAEQGWPLRISVNLSARDLVDQRLLAEIRAMLSDGGLPSNALCLEITEQHLLNDRDAAVHTLRSLSSLGVMLSVDDYGTGYSGLARLRDLPVHEIKIDRSFVGTMMTDNANAAIVRSTCDLARELGLSIVAEGVEDPAALPTLIGLGCDIAQGFLLARPMDVEALRIWLATRQAEARNESSSAYAEAD